MCPPIVIELGGDNLAVCDIFTLLPDLFVLHIEIIVLADVENEIDVPGKDTGDVHDDFVRQACVRAAFK